MAPSSPRICRRCVTRCCRRSDAAGSDALRTFAQGAFLRRVRGHRVVGGAAHQFWRELAEKVTLISEGDNHRKFGVIVEGFVEVSTNGTGDLSTRSERGRRRNGLPAPERLPRQATVVTLEPTLFLEINSAALGSEFGRSAGALQQGSAGQAPRTPARSQQGARQTGTDRRSGQLFGRIFRGLSQPLELL
jgi:hypothetical protein